MYIYTGFSEFLLRMDTKDYEQELESPEHFDYDKDYFDTRLSAGLYP